jgi:hypothetical protein
LQRVIRTYAGIAVLGCLTGKEQFALHLTNRDIEAEVRLARRGHKYLRSFGGSSSQDAQPKPSPPATASACASTTSPDTRVSIHTGTKTVVNEEMRDLA